MGSLKVEREREELVRAMVSHLPYMEMTLYDGRLQVPGDLQVTERDIVNGADEEAFMEMYAANYTAMNQLLATVFSKQYPDILQAMAKNDRMPSMEYLAELYRFTAAAEAAVMTSMCLGTEPHPEMVKYVSNIIRTYKTLH